MTDDDPAVPAVPPNHVAALRVARGMTQQQLAAAADVSIRTVFAIERGDYCRPPTKRAILRALGKDYYYDRLEVFPNDAA